MFYFNAILFLFYILLMCSVVAVIVDAWVADSLSRVHVTTWVMIAALTMFSCWSASNALGHAIDERDKSADLTAIEG